MLVNPFLRILWRAKPSSAKDQKYAAVETALPLGANRGVARPRASTNRGTSVIKLRRIVSLSIALLLGGCMQATLTPVSDPNFTARDKQQLANPPYRQASIPPAYQRQVVPYHRMEAPGSILVDTDGRYVYYVLPEGRAIRYGAIV